MRYYADFIVSLSYIVIYIFCYMLKLNISIQYRPVFNFGETLARILCTKLFHTNMYFPWIILHNIYIYMVMYSLLLSSWIVKRPWCLISSNIPRWFRIMASPSPQVQRPTVILHNSFVIPCHTSGAGRQRWATANWRVNWLLLSLIDV